jgi:hypothetical protein
MLATSKVMGDSKWFREDWVDNYLYNGKNVNDYSHKRFQSYRERLTKDAFAALYQPERKSK